MPRTTSWRLRPALPLLLLSYLFLIVTPIAGHTYDYRAIRPKRSPNESVDRSKSTTNTKTTTSGTPTNNNYQHNQNAHRTNDAIIFPDDEYICNERREGKPYCLDVPNYEESTGLNQIDSQNFEKFKSYFKDDILQTPNITQRMNTDPQEEYYCSSTPQLIYPKSAETKESKWMLVVQHPNHKQGILVEQCDKEAEPCRFDDLLPKFYTSRCKQSYIFRTMIVSVNGKLQEEQVKMPSCCKCVLRHSQD